MVKKLYKVRIETELMVMATNKKEAITIGKKNAANEIAEYGTGEAKVVKSISDIPETWKNAIPYGSNGSVENKTCKDILYGDSVDNITDDEMKHILALNEKGKKIIEGQDEPKVTSETRSDPKPSRELDWQETGSGRTLPSLRLNIPSKK